MSQGRRGDGDAGGESWRLEWIPRRLKMNVKLVLSVGEEDVLKELKRDVICSTDNFVEVCDSACFSYRK